MTNRADGAPPPKLGRAKPWTAVWYSRWLTGQRHATPITGKRPPSSRLAQGAVTEALRKLLLGAATSGSGASTSRLRKAGVAIAPPASGGRERSSRPLRGGARRAGQSSAKASRGEGRSRV